MEENKKELQDNKTSFQMEEKNIGIRGNKTVTDKFGITRVGVIEKFNSFYETEEIKTSKRK